LEIEEHLLGYVIPWMERWRNRVGRYRRAQEIGSEGITRLGNLSAETTVEARENERRERGEEREESEGRGVERREEGGSIRLERVIEEFEAGDVSEVVIPPPIPPRPPAPRRSYASDTRSLRRRRAIVEYAAELAEGSQR
jgi:ribosomal protein L21E